MGDKLAIYATNLMCVAIPLKIFNNARIEMKLEEQERALLRARVEALQSQINPHFLFNTLNSVSSLVRRDPDTARELIVKLANILRRLLRQTDTFVPLRDEIDFIDDYLDIEVVRFGQDKLRVVKELEPASLDVQVPSMLLQPLVENSIKHGLSPKIGGGCIYIRSRLEGPNLLAKSRTMASACRRAVPNPGAEPESAWPTLRNGSKCSMAPRPAFASTATAARGRWCNSAYRSCSRWKERPARTLRRPLGEPVPNPPRPTPIGRSQKSGDRIKPGS